VELNVGIAVFLIATLIVEFYGEFKMFVENGLVTFGTIIGIRVGYYNKLLQSIPR
jgi:uncharacterized membrane protein